MSKHLPQEAIRKYREIHDVSIKQFGQPAVFYRYEGQVSSQSTASNPAEEYVEEFNLTDSRDIFADPVDTNIKVNWPGSLQLTPEGQVNVDDEDQIRGRIPFSLQPTIESYFKTPIINALDPDNLGQDVYADAGEEDLVIRLEVVDIVSDLEDNTARMEVVLSIKRTDDHLHPNDNNILDGVDSSKFFQ